jgi:hypothetical protein
MWSRFLAIPAVASVGLCSEVCLPRATRVASPPLGNPTVVFCAAMISPRRHTARSRISETLLSGLGKCRAARRYYGSGDPRPVELGDLLYYGSRRSRDAAANSRSDAVVLVVQRLGDAFHAMANYNETVKRPADGTRGHLTLIVTMQVRDRADRFRASKSRNHVEGCSRLRAEAVRTNRVCISYCTYNVYSIHMGL